MFERFLRIFIFIFYLFDTVFASYEKNNNGKGKTLDELLFVEPLLIVSIISDIKKIRPAALNRPVQMDQFVMPS
ncbi:hypothetical protein Y032_0393g600 [Ancylostoma ceylanicum]|uniref:Uncharacterized protein n=1 Tax=Ancylostoma ceylanicum TaxID=53326 RepID=A0A016RRS0_9BILA|nr:hypothetical protein Y032_0393g600 [Ancylostoma ceylanicum]